MLGLVRGLVVDVDVGALNVGQVLELELELLGDVVGGAQGGVGVHDDVDLGDEAGAGMVAPHRVDAADQVAVGDADVRDEALHLDRGDDADEQHELLERGAQPDARDEHRQDDGAHGVDPPRQLGPADRRQDTEAVDEQVVAVVLPQNVHLAVLVLDAPAVEEEGELGQEGNGHGDDGRQVEAVKLVVVRLGELLRREGDEDHGHGRHHEAEEDVADRLEAGLAAGEAVRVHALDGAVGQDQERVAQRVEDGVRHGRKQRERARRDSAVHLEDGQDHVGREAAVDGDLVAQVVVALRLLRLGPMLLDRLEQPLNHLVLLLVEAFDLAGPQLVLAGHAAAQARPGRPGPRRPLARGVGLDLAELRLGLESRL